MEQKEEKAEELPPAPSGYQWTEADRALLRAQNTLPQVPLGTAFAAITNVIASVDMVNELRYHWIAGEPDRVRAFERLPAYVRRSAMGQRMEKNIRSRDQRWTQELTPRHSSRQDKVTVILTAPPQYHLWNSMHHAPMALHAEPPTSYQ